MYTAKELQCLWISWLLLGIAYSQRPPRLLPQARDTHRIVPEGTNVQLPCPVDGDPDSMFFEWYKGNEPLTMLGTDRFRVTSGGTLKIKEAVSDDTGLYSCRVVNGFGKVQLNISLIVLTSHDKEAGNSQDQGQPGNLYPDGDDFDLSGVSAGKPRFSQTKPPQGNVIYRPMGSSVRLRCDATAIPRPQIIWLKNGKHLGQSDAQLGSVSKKFKWSLPLHNLQTSDSGNYTCIVYNVFGSINNSFMLDVVERIRTKPEMTGTHPLNTTVEQGGTAVLQCRVRSDVPPHIQWMKKVNDDEQNPEQKLIKIHDEYFRTLKSTEVMERPDGSFLNKFLIPEVNENDSGKYLCLGANTIGYSYRSAFLTVLARTPDHQVPRSVTSLPFPIIVAVTVVCAVVTAAVAALLLHCRKRRQATQLPRSTPMTKSRDTLETKHAYLGMAYNPEVVTMKSCNGHPPTTRLYVPSNSSSSPGPPGSLCL